MGTLLYNRTCYTLLKSTLTPAQLADFARESGYKTIGITDHNVLFGVQKARQTGLEKGIRFIYGMETDALWMDELYSFLVYARNDDGYADLSFMSSRIQASGNPLDFETFRSRCKDCIVILPDTCPPIASLLNKDDSNDLVRIITVLKESLPSFYMGYSYLPGIVYEKRSRMIEYVCGRLGVPKVALSLGLYRNPEDFEAYKALMAIDQGLTIDDQRLVFENQRHLLTAEALAQYPEDAVLNTDEIATACEVTFDSHHAHLPEFETPEGYDAKQYLKSLAYAGLKKRLKSNTGPEAYRKRFDYELSVINRMGFANYFLIVYDFILNARRRKINIGPGRGSAPGSLIAYCLGITHVDPLEYDLLFERFLNPSRTTMPDIDTDVPDDRRQDVIGYLCERYGNDHVAHIVTFGTLAARQVINDLCKVYAIPAYEAGQLKKMIGDAPKVNLRQVYESNAAFRRYIDSDERYVRMLQTAFRLEGLPRNMSTHAGGIVLTKEPLEDVVPLVRADDTMMATQYTMEYLEPLGLIKMDILGIINLTIIAEAVERINQYEKLDILKIPLDDQMTFEIFRKADTEGIFQSESDGMKQLLKKIRPNSIRDIALTFALYRPGPMRNIDELLEHRAHPETVHYLHPSLEPVLKETYGIMVYQEQIMQVSQIMAGFPLAKADIMRKAMSKKKMKEMKAMEQDFISGAMKNGYTRETAQQTYDMIERFAEYGFNKSHSVVYALFAYQMAYLKAHYPNEFYRSLLNRCIGRDAAASRYIKEIRSRGITMLGPDINKSTDEYTIENGQLRYPLNGIKNVSTSIVRNIIDDRNKRGPYTDLVECILRLLETKANKNVITRLVDAGALDGFGYNRFSILQGLDVVISYAALVEKKDDGQMSFDLNILPKPQLARWKENERQRAERERDALGFYLSEHPLTRIKQNSGLPIIDLSFAISRKGNIKVMAEVIRVKEHRTKGGSLMAFVSAADETAVYDFVFMPEIYARSSAILKSGALLYIEGRIDDRDSCLVKNVRLYKEERGEENV